MTRLDRPGRFRNLTVGANLAQISLTARRGPRRSSRAHWTERLRLLGERCPELSGAGRLDDGHALAGRHVMRRARRDVHETAGWVGLEAFRIETLALTEKPRSLKNRYVLIYGMRVRFDTDRARRSDPVGPGERARVRIAGQHRTLAAIRRSGRRISGNLDRRGRDDPRWGIGQRNAAGRREPGDE